MITVHLPSDLAEEFHTDPDLILAAGSLKGMLYALDAQHPGMGRWLSEADGSFRQNLSVFVAGRRLTPSEDASTRLPDGAEVWILRAVSGG